MNMRLINVAAVIRRIALKPTIKHLTAQYTH